MESYYFECQCHTDEHTIRFVVDDDGTVWTSIFLLEQSLRCRIWSAVKYIFGYKCKYGHFDCTMLKEEDKQKLIDLLQKSMELAKAVDQKWIDSLTPSPEESE